MADQTAEKMGRTSASPDLARSRLRMAFRKLGGKKLLGVEVRSDADFATLVDRGVPVASLAELADREGLNPEDVDRLIIRRRTLAHRKARNQPLNRTESERAIRVASITALAEETFVDPGKAKAWLRQPMAILDGKRPIDLLDSEPGARVIEQLLHRIGHGVAA